MVQRLEPPILPYLSEGSDRLPSKPVVSGLERPVVNVPDPSLSYPVLSVPTQEEFDAAVKADQQKKEKEQEEKSRGLPDSKPVVPQIQAPIPQQGKENNSLVTQSTTPDLGVPQIQVPFVGPVPVPPKEQVMLAGTTATASVAAAIVGKSFVEWMIKKFKPVVERLYAQAKKMMNKDLTDYELQLFFAFEKQVQMKKVAKLLKKEQKQEKLRQYKEAQSKKS